MIVLAVAWTYAVAIAAIYGRFTLALLERDKNPEPAGLPLLVLLGFIVLAVIAQFLSLVMPLAVQAHLIVLILAAVLVVARRRTISEIRDAAGHVAATVHRKPSLGVVLLVVLLLLLYFGSQHPKGYDTGLYHAQAIRWIEEYGVVPGLANLHGRLGFNNASFALEALFSFSFLLKSPLHSLNGLILFAFLAQLAVGAFSDLPGDRVRMFRYFALALGGFALLYLRKFASSPGTDVSAAVYAWLGAVLWVENSFKNGSSTKSLLAVPIVIVYATTVKLSVAPFLLLAVFAAWKIWRQARAHLPALIGAAVVISLPFVLRNIYVSGYLVFPVLFTAISNLDWSVPREIASQLQEDIYAWGRVPAMPPNEVLAMPLREWVPLWWDELPGGEKRLVAVTLLLAVASSVSVFFRMLRARERLIGTRTMLAIALVFMTGLFYWFFTAPAIRFAVSYFGLAVSIGIGHFFSLATAGIQLSARFSRDGTQIDIWNLLRRRSSALFLSVLVLGLLFEPQVRGVIQNPSLMVRPQGYRVYEVKEITLDGAQFFIPVSNELYRTGYFAFPAAPSKPVDIGLREKEVSSGFAYE